jgi:hypothetical protein
MTPGPVLPRWKAWLFGVIAVAGIPAAMLLLIEGASSFILFMDEFTTPEPVVRERAYTDYDTLLGWSARRGFSDRNLYGTGISLSTNLQGFRNDHEIDRRVPPGRIRVLCSGDSFTLGWGVDDGHSWCNLLERTHPAVEAVNMGQAGYGVDQAYLWYKRDGQPLDHHAHLFAVIDQDFYRMMDGEFLGYAKPALSVAGDTVRVDNVPVPRWSYLVPGLASSIFYKRISMGRLATARLMDRVRMRLAPSGYLAADSATWRLADHILGDLARINRAKNSRLVVVYLPTLKDRVGSASAPWRQRLASAASRHNFVFVDLVEDFRRESAVRLDSLFLSWDAHGHYSAEGHAWVAERVYPHLVAALQVGRGLDTSAVAEGP